LVDVFAYQEALLIEVIFGFALLVMAWVGFRRWLQHKETASRLTTEQLDRVEARLKAIEQIVTDGGAQIPADISAPRAEQLPDVNSER
jgi:hypothetical protein